MRIATRALVSAALLQAAPAAAPAAERLARALGYRTRTGGAGVALTFDDGPHPQGTPAVLDQLDELGVAATFFLSGEQVARHPRLAREVVARGHEVGVHGHRHVLLTIRGRRETAHDLRRARDVIEWAAEVATRSTGRPTASRRRRLFTPRPAGAAPVLWSRWGRDWRRGATAASVAALATRNLRGGEVLLLHDSDCYSAPRSWSVTVAALPLIVESVQARSLEIVPLA